MCQLVISPWRERIKQGKESRVTNMHYQIRRSGQVFRMVSRDLRASDQQCPLSTAPTYGCAGTNATPRKNWLTLSLQKLPAQNCVWDSYFINSGIVMKTNNQQSFCYLGLSTVLLCPFYSTNYGVLQGSSLEKCRSEVGQ